MTNKKLAALRALLTLLIAASASFVGCGPPGPRALLDGEKFIKQGRYTEAIERLEKATALLPRTAQAWNHLGLAYHGNRQLEDALRAYQTALSLDGKLAAVRYNLGCLYLEQGNLIAAGNELHSYTLLQPADAEGKLRLGTVHLRSKRLDEADRCFTNVLAHRPGDPAALNNLGVVQFQRRRWQEARNYFDLARKKDPTFAPAQLNFAVVSHHALNDRPAALNAYRQFLSLDSKAAESQKVDEIARQLEAELSPKPIALQPVPAPVPARTNPAVAAAPPRPATNPPPASLPRTNPPAVAARVTPSNPPAVAVRPHSDLPRPATSVVSIAATPVGEDLVIKPAQDITVRSTPATLPAPASNTAASRLTDSNTDAAKRGFLARLNPFTRKKEDEPKNTGTNVLSAAIPVAGDPPPPPVPRYPFQSPAAPRPGNRSLAEPAFARGVKAHQGGNRRKAIEEYQAALRADPAWFDVYYNLALAAQDTGELGLALIAHETALALKPDSADSRYQFALALKSGGYLQDAADQLEKLLKSNPSEARAHLSLGNLYAQQLRQPTLARQHYSRLLEINPSHPEAAKIRVWLGNNP